MKFLHTADWQIGKPFRNFGEKESMLRQARLLAIENIGKLAVAEGIRDVLVAGDLYDTEAPTQKTMLEPLERMKRYPGVVWHVISGNHDPHRGNGLWDRVRIAGVPNNVRLHLLAEPVELGGEAILLPAPMRRKSEVNDLSEWMDSAATPSGLIRIGLAHGSVAGFDVGGEANNPIAPDRAKRAGLDYLALGDWHRTTIIGPATWYAGTPEIDRFNSQEQGQVLLVEISGAGASPTVSRRKTGSYSWLTISEDINDTADIDTIEARLRALPDLSTTVMKFSLKGTLPLSGRADLNRRLAGLEAAMFHFEAEFDNLLVRPTAADLESIDFGGVLREAADTLKALAEDVSRTETERHRAENALIQLYVMTTSQGDMLGDVT